MSWLDSLIAGVDDGAGALLVGGEAALLVGGATDCDGGLVFGWFVWRPNMRTPITAATPTNATATSAATKVAGPIRRPRTFCEGREELWDAATTFPSVRR